MQRTDSPYTFSLFSPFPHLVHGISTKSFGSMKQPDGSLDYHTLSRFSEALSISQQAVCMQQVHSGTVRIVDRLQDNPIPQTDGLITTRKQIPLAVVTADCLPILFYDTKEEIIGVAHAGYKGILQGIIAKMIRGFRELGSDPKDLFVGIGPGIGGCCYAVPSERIALFKKTFPGLTGYVLEKEGKSFLDLSKLVQMLLEKEGISSSHIECAQLCTADNHAVFYSYRKGDVNGRFVSMLLLKE